MNNPIADYANLSADLQKQGLLYDAAEAQGLIAGALCAGIEKPHHLLALPPDLQAIWQNIEQRLWQELKAGQFPIHLILPEDHPLPALIHWCEGFLYGIGLGGQARLQKMGADAQEALQDLIQITRLNEYENDEEAEMELAEYLWVALLTIWQDLND